MPRKNAKTPKAAKPYVDFPLTAHRNGQFCKKIRGKIHYFGSISDPDAALAKYLDQRDDLQAGRQPRTTTAGDLVTVRYLFNAWLAQAEAKQAAGDLAPRTFTDYKYAAEVISGLLGKSLAVDQLRPLDFARMRNSLAVESSPGRLTKLVTITRMVFRWGWESDLLTTPVKLGPDFKGASKKQHREKRNEAAAKLFEAEEIRTLLEAARQPLKAMILLGLNAGLGNADIAEMEYKHIKDGWLVYPRGKTAIPRRIPLWPETLEAIEEAKSKRRQPKRPEHAELLFVTNHGGCWCWHEDGKTNNEISKQFRKLLSETELYRERRTFYALRHTFQTVGDEARDPVATSAIMGHADSSMASVYREKVSDDRLLNVSEHVRAWLFTTDPA